nr:FkbM family methyltransferase [uncultured Dyadobacter sp.]
MSSAQPGWLPLSLPATFSDTFKEIKFRFRVFKFNWLTSGFDPVNKVFSFIHDNVSIKIKVPSVDDFISFHILKHQTFYDLADLNKIKKYIGAGSVVIDAGANIGNHTIFFAKICKAGKVFSFEPQSQIFSILLENIALNDMEDVVVPYRVALGDNNTRAAINYRDDHAVSKKLAQVNHGGVYLKEDETGNFEVRTLDSLLLGQINRLDFIKMDIQGFEEKAVKGAKCLIAKFKPIIQLECATNREYEEVILPLMSEMNYKVMLRLNIDAIFEPIV